MYIRTFSVCLAILVAISPAGFNASAENTIFDAMKTKCSRDIKTYCKAVTPGEARLALCLYAHEDKISAQCELAVYDAVVAIEISLTTLGSYARTCRADLLKFCATEEWGRGRLYACLTKNKNALVADCKAAVDSAKPDLQKLGVEIGE